MLSRMKKASRDVARPRSVPKALVAYFLTDPMKGEAIEAALNRTRASFRAAEADGRRRSCYSASIIEKFCFQLVRRACSLRLSIGCVFALASLRRTVPGSRTDAHCSGLVSLIMPPFPSIIRPAPGMMPGACAIGHRRTASARQHRHPGIATLGCSLPFKAVAHRMQPPLSVPKPASPAIFGARRPGVPRGAPGWPGQPPRCIIALGILPRNGAK